MITQEARATMAAKRKLQQYSLGFAMSVVLTIIAYLFTVNHVFSGWTLAYVIVGLAVVQVIVQLLFFLHIGHESEPRWNLLTLDFTLIIVVILVFGSLWIMNHLNYHMDGSSANETNNYIVNDEGYQQK
jgi:cytochrome o ubiquinol oxidase subunit IV